MVQRRPGTVATEALAVWLRPTGDRTKVNTTPPGFGVVGAAVTGEVAAVVEAGAVDDAEVVAGLAAPADALAVSVAVDVGLDVATLLDVAIADAVSVGPFVVAAA